jgi:hypothetical protein
VWKWMFQKPLCLGQFGEGLVESTSECLPQPAVYGRCMAYCYLHEPWAFPLQGCLRVRIVGG